MNLPRSIIASSILFLLATGTMGLKELPEPGKTFAYPSPTDCGWVAMAYHMREGGACLVRVFHEGGKVVASFREEKPAGPTFSRVNACPLAPGVYLYRLTLRYDSGTSEKLSGKFVVKK